MTFEIQLEQDAQEIEKLFQAGYDVNILQYFEGFEYWYAKRLEEAGLDK